MDILGPENICFMKEKGAYYLGNWAIVEYSAGKEILLILIKIRNKQLAYAVLIKLQRC